MAFWAKYNTQTTFEFPMIKRGVVDFAVSADWTPASTDAAISKDNGNLADTTNTVAIVGGSPTRGAALWKITLTSTELSCAVAHVQIIDAATKAVEDQAFTVYTYGNASAFFAGDWSDIVRLGLTALPNAAAEAAGGLYTRGTGAGQINQPANGSVDTYTKGLIGTALTEGAAGRLKAAFTTFFDVASSVLTTASVNQTGDAYARLGAPAGASVSADIAAIKTDTGNLVTRITSTLFSGITSLAQWLGLIAGKQTGNSTARTEIRATGGGSGTFDETTDSVEAIRDRGDAAWTTAVGFSTLTQADIRTATGLASANLDTQLSGIQSDTDNLQTRIPADLTADGLMKSDMLRDGGTLQTAGDLVALINTLTGYVDTEVAAIKAKTDNLPASPAAVGSAMTLTSGERDSIAAALLDLANAIETGLTVRQTLRLEAAALAGKISGAETTTTVIRNAVADSKARITATVDANGNRSAVTTDVT